MQSTGQSGHRLSPHFGDLLERWRGGGSIPMRTDRAAILAETDAVLRLRPR